MALILCIHFQTHPPRRSQHVESVTDPTGERNRSDWLFDESESGQEKRNDGKRQANQ